LHAYTTRRYWKYSIIRLRIRSSELLINFYYNFAYESTSLTYPSFSACRDDLRFAVRSRSWRWGLPWGELVGRYYSDDRRPEFQIKSASQYYDLHILKFIILSIQLHLILPHSFPFVAHFRLSTPAQPPKNRRSFPDVTPVCPNLSIREMLENYNIPLLFQLQFELYSIFVSDE
jgi:hypothetical protein